MHTKYGFKEFQGCIRRKMARCLLIYGLTVFAAMASVAVVVAGPAPSGWYQVNQDGFKSGRAPSDDGTVLLPFGGSLLAFDGVGVFEMKDPTTRDWTELAVPAPPSGPGPDAIFKPFGNYIYAYSYTNGGQLWWINGSNWNKVTSAGLPGGVSPLPMTLFSGRIYGVYYTSSGTFEIWRSPNIGSTVANWERVVMNSFGDPTNNQGVDIMIVYNSKIYAGVNTLAGIFGDPRSYGTGVEIWQSASGNNGTWTQVNIDGFGTLFQGCLSGECNFPIQQVIGSAAVYRAEGQSQLYLYIGTKSHFGAEIWRYDGTGLNGWTNVTPPWAGYCQFGCGPGRNEAMTVFKGELYLAEGFPKAHLSKYDGTTWSVLVEGPNPFDPDYNRLNSLAVLNDKLYVSSAGYHSSPRGDQVWSFPMAVGYAHCFESIDGVLINGFDILNDFWLMGETATYLGKNCGGPVIGWVAENRFAFYYDAPTGCSAGDEGAFHFGHVWDLKYKLTTTSGIFTHNGALAPCRQSTLTFSGSIEEGEESINAGETLCFNDTLGYRHVMNFDGYYLVGYTENTECGATLPVVGAVEGDLFSFYLDVPSDHPICNIEGLMYQGHVSTLSGKWRRTPAGGFDQGTFQLSPCNTANANHRPEGVPSPLRKE